MLSTSLDQHLKSAGSLLRGVLNGLSRLTVRAFAEAHLLCAHIEPSHPAWAGACGKRNTRPGVNGC